MKRRQPTAQAEKEVASVEPLSARNAKMLADFLDYWTSA